MREMGSSQSNIETLRKNYSIKIKMRKMSVRRKVYWERIVYVTVDAEGEFGSVNIKLWVWWLQALG